MSIVKMHNKKTGVTYVYESTSYWDKEKKQPRNHRKLIGKLDPVTGEIVPTNKSRNTAVATEVATGEPVCSSDANGFESEVPREDLVKALNQRESEIKALEMRVRELELACQIRDDALKRIASLSERTLNR